MENFYDLLAMSRLFEINGVTLATAIRTTFTSRDTTIPLERPPSLTRVLSEDSQKLRQWRSILARDPLLIDEPDLDTVICEVGNFIIPLERVAIDDNRSPSRWTYERGWSSIP